MIPVFDRNEKIVGYLDERHALKDRPCFTICDCCGSVSIVGLR